MRLSSILGPVVLSVALVAGCGDDDGGGGGGGGGNVAVEDVPGLLAASICDVFTTCIGDTLAAVFFGGDCAGRFERQFRNQEFGSFEEAIAAGTLVYDGTKVDDCLAAIEALGCDFGSDRIPAVCEEAFAGTVPPGMPCSLDAECMGDGFCSISSMCPGVCATLVAAGGECEDSDQCGRGLVCQGDGTCGTPAGAGEQCGGMTDIECEGGLDCMGEGADTPGTCGSIGSLFTATMGMPCNPDGGPLCVEGLSCAVTGITGMMPVLECVGTVGSGAACQTSIPDMCPDNEYCNADIEMGTFMGTCTPLPGPGMPCAAAIFGAQCASGSGCDESGSTPTCRTIQDNGGACADDAICYSEHCDTGTGTCAGPEFCTGGT
jgi:hypothetical protein